MLTSTTLFSWCHGWHKLVDKLVDKLVAKLAHSTNPRTLDKRGSFGASTDRTRIC